jgi:hypothetical protein
MAGNTLRDVIERARQSVCGEYWVESLSRDDQHLIDEYGAGCRVYSLEAPGRFTWSKACETDFPRTSERGLALMRARNRYKALQSQYRAALYWLQFKGLLRRQGEPHSSWQQRIRYELESAMQREEQLLSEEQASQDGIGRPHNLLSGWWISWELAADAIRLLLKRDVGQSHETLKEALNSGAIGIRDSLWKRPLHVFGIDDDLLSIRVEYYPNCRRELRWSDVEINGSEILDWLFELSIAESPPATDDLPQPSNADETKSPLTRGKKGGNKDAHDWGEGRAFLNRLWETNGDPALSENQVEGWRTDGDIWFAISEHLGQSYEKEKRKLKAPDPSTVGKKFRSELAKLRNVNRPN